MSLSKLWETMKVRKDGGLQSMGSGQMTQDLATVLNFSASFSLLQSICDLDHAELTEGRRDSKEWGHLRRGLPVLTAPRL